MRSKNGFTLIELMIFSAIFSVIMIAFISILVAITTVQGRQSGVSEVTQQSQFLLQQIQYYVERSSLIEMNSDVATDTLKLRMAASAEDPIYIYLSNNTVYIKQTDGGIAQPLTSNKVLVSNMSFTKRSNAPGHDSVAVSFSVSYNTGGIQQRFAEGLQTAIARVSAATFDSDVRAGSSNQYVIGAASGEWKSINGTIYFNGSNVGVGALSPGAKLQVSGGDVYLDTTTKGVVLRSSDGACWRVTPSTTGTLTTASLTCP